jgi:hypothetical protein
MIPRYKEDGQKINWVPQEVEASVLDDVCKQIVEE